MDVELWSGIHGVQGIHGMHGIHGKPTSLYFKKGGKGVERVIANFPESDAFNADGEFDVDLLKGENRSLTNVVTFGLMGDE